MVYFRCMAILVILFAPKPIQHILQAIKLVGRHFYNHRTNFNKTQHSNFGRRRLRHSLTHTLTDTHHLFQYDRGLLLIGMNECLLGWRLRSACGHQVPRRMCAATAGPETVVQLKRNGEMRLSALTF